MDFTFINLYFILKFRFVKLLQVTITFVVILVKCSPINKLVIKVSYFIKPFISLLALFNLKMVK